MSKVADPAGMCTVAKSRSHGRRSRVAAVFMIAALAWWLGAARVSAYEAIQVNNGAKIVGTVKVAGKFVPRPPLTVNKNREVCGDHISDESLVVGPENGLRYAVLTLANITKGRAVELEAGYALDNEKCRFVPHVQAISLGQWIELKNTDPILHSADALLGKQQTLFNAALWPGRALRKPVAYPGVVRINCGVHSWMDAYVVVTDNPYHAVTDLYGAYEIDDIPPGTYKLRLWHELLGTQEKEVRLEPGRELQVNFEINAEGK
jgi:hypothetical protein